MSASSDALVMKGSSLQPTMTRRQRSMQPRQTISVFPRGSSVAALDNILKQLVTTTFRAASDMASPRKAKKSSGAAARRPTALVFLVNNSRAEDVGAEDLLDASAWWAQSFGLPVCTARLDIIDTTASSRSSPGGTMKPSALLLTIPTHAAQMPWSTAVAAFSEDACVWALERLASAESKSESLSPDPNLLASASISAQVLMQSMCNARCWIAGSPACLFRASSAV
mmetsp:Transcript_4240/g.16564  ORF Transcript_4240/g.16564 Transcript_4240/m.16564 type:complete len:226 (-) Transcript_4240:802-1479(-)